MIGEEEEEYKDEEYKGGRKMKEAEIEEEDNKERKEERIMRGQGPLQYWSMGGGGRNREALPTQRGPLQTELILS